MRPLTNAFKTAIDGTVVLIGAIVELDYPDTPVRAWTGIGDLNWDGKVWSGIGDFGEISAIMEKAGAEAGQVKLAMSGVPTEARTRALQNTSASRAMRFWLAAFAEDPGTGTWSVLPDPWKAFSGLTDVHKIHAGAIEVTVETALARLKYPKIARYNHAEQQRHYPGDLGCEYGASVNEKPFYWGSPTPAPRFTGAGGGFGGGGAADVSVLV
jgi:hypothetical protein